MRAGMALMMVFVVFAAVMGVKAILGAFVAGALFSFVFRDKGILETKMSSLGFGFFVPVFFISVGASFDLARITDTRVLPLAGIVLGASLLIKTLVSLPLWPRFGPRGVISCALLLSTPLTLLVVIAKIGRQRGRPERCGGLGPGACGHRGGASSSRRCTSSSPAAGPNLLNGEPGRPREVHEGSR